MLFNTDSKSLTRRGFVKLGGAAALFCKAFESAGAEGSTPGVAGRRRPLQPFGYADVGLAPGPHEAQLEQTHQILMGLNEDSLLRPFRMAAGFPASGNDLGGWYSLPRYLGETFGQWVSALSRYYAIKGDETTRLKVERLIGAYAQTLEPTGNIFQLNGNPLYFHDKLVLGVQDAARFCRNEQARELLPKVLDTSQYVLEKKASEDLYKKIHEGGENYNFAETYFEAWSVSGDKRYYELAKRDLDDGFIEPLSRGENVLAGRHAYSHVNTLCCAAKAYLVSGEDRYLQAAVNGLAFVEQQSFATGGFGPAECFVPRQASPPDAPIPTPAISSPGESILKETIHFETGCGCYAHFKLTRYLLRITQDSHYGDSMERLMYNAALGILPLSKLGKAFYQSNYHPRAKKAYFDGYWNMAEDDWPCCSGTFTQLAADYRLGVYFRDDQGIFVNLYIPSALRWSHRDIGISLTQAGEYPLSDRVLFTIEPSRPVTLTLHFRIPAWAQQPQLRVNGKPVTHSIQPGTFAAVRRRWRSGEQVELILPKHLELKPADERHPDLVGLCCGPLVLFAISDDTPQVTRAQLLAARQPAPASAEWFTESANGLLRFLPWWVIKDETYTTYMTV